MLQQYLAELSKIRLLTAEEEKALWNEFKSGEVMLLSSREARRRLIESYQPLVYKIASRLTDREELFFDLIQEGALGLIEAVESFDLKYAVKFSTFAQYRIRGRMIDYLKKQRNNYESLEVAIHDEELAGILAKIVDVQVNIEDEVVINVLNLQINQAIARLNPKEQKVIRDLYLLDKEPVTSAKELNISLSYFYKLQKKALQKLRGMLSKLRAEIKMSG